MSSTLLSSAEESNIFNYLDAFDWELDESVGAGMPPFDPSLPAAGPPMPVQHMDVDPYFADGKFLQRPAQMHPFNAPHPQHQSSPLLPPPVPQPSQLQSTRASSLSAPESSSSSGRTPKPLLTQPQKRLNHIMSEQKRRNAIREGYETLAMLLSPGDVSVKLVMLASPEGKVQAAAMASEFGYTGRPGRARGSGKNGKAKKMGKGKSGMLFRAVEFCKFLQQDVDALRAEVDRLEKEFAAQSLATPASSSSQPVT
ncbi:helix loop helix DNA-binding domain protein [Ceratobasidium sp. AG-Ba]|nr:helix loop helix DNA-binding domain protein [Ceratobasidium sp. AG-Ba]